MFNRASKCFPLFPGFWEHDYWNVNTCVCLPCIIINVGVIFCLWHWGKTVGWVWQQCWPSLRHLWLKLIRNWRKLHNVLLHKLYLLPYIIRIMERKKGMWVTCHVEWMSHEPSMQGYQKSFIIMNDQLHYYWPVYIWLPSYRHKDLYIAVKDN